MISTKTKIPEKLRKVLIENPQWILHDNELLNHLINAENKSHFNKVVDLRDIFVQRIKSELKHLSEVHNYTISAAYDNFLGASNLHRCIIKILEQRTLLGLLDLLNGDIRKILKTSKIKLYIFANELPILNHPIWIPMNKSDMLNLLRTAKLSKKQIITLYSEPRYILKTIDSKYDNHNICSEALLSLKTYLTEDDQAILSLGSKNKKTFSQNNKSDYLNLLAKVISHQLYILLKRVRKS